MDSVKFNTFFRNKSKVVEKRVKQTWTGDSDNIYNIYLQKELLQGILFTSVILSIGLY